MNTKDLKNRQNINRINAWKYFYPEGNGKAKKGYVLHHKDKTLINTDVDEGEIVGAREGKASLRDNMIRKINYKPFTADRLYEG